MGIGLFLGPVVMTLLLLRGAEAGPSPQPSVAVSNFNRAVAAIQGSPASSSCQLQLFAQATYKPGSTTVAGTLTVTNPTSAAINVFSPPTAIVTSVVPKSQNSSPAVKALLASDKEGALRQFNPYSGPYYGTNGFDYIMAIDEVTIPDCFAGASPVYGQTKAVQIGPKQTVTCKFTVNNAVIQGTDPKAVVVSVARLQTARDAQAIVRGDSGTCAALAKLGA